MSPTVSESAQSAPLIVRMAGLSVDAVPVSDLDGRIEDALELEALLENARSEMVDRLYQAINGAEKKRRHSLLKVKRDCHNGRSLTRHRESKVWSHVEDVDAGLAARILELEDQLTSWKTEFETAFEHEVRHETEFLLDLMKGPRFACGLSVASPQLARRCQKLLEKRVEDHRRPEKLLVAKLLRYTTRAALKLSPFSTFTPVGLGVLRSESELDRVSPQRSEAIRLLDGEWTDSSLMRIRRYVLDQYWELLRRYRPLRQHLHLGLNNSRIRSKDQRISFLRPSHWRPDDNELQYFEESLVRIGIKGGWIEQLDSIFAGSDPNSDPNRDPGPGTSDPAWREVVDQLSARLETSADEVATQLDRLIEAGYLHLLPPWRTDEAHLEKIMLRELRELPVAAELEAFLAPLERLVALEDGILTSVRADRDLEEIKRLTEVCWRAAADLSCPTLETPDDEKPHELYQDVFRRPVSQSESQTRVQAIATIQRDAAEHALRSVEPLVRYSNLFDHRQDFAITLGAMLGKLAPDRDSFSLFEVFEIAQEHWREYVSFVVSARGSSRWGGTWNPMNLPELEALDRFRRQVREAIPECMNDGPDGRRIDPEALAAMLDQAPGQAASSSTGCCMFLQLGAKDGSLWVLNRMKEGTGRFSSRYTPSMSDTERAAYIDELARRSVLEVDGEPVELLDIQCIQGDTLNVHAPQTIRQLILPGATSDLPPERRLTLTDLRICLDRNRIPQLRDREGRRYFAVHLGGGYHDYMPTVVKFLCLFGPNEMGAVFPRPRVHRHDDLRIQARTLIGSVVIHRKSWTARTDSLRAMLSPGAGGHAVTNADVFERINRWRLARGIPRRVFLRERVHHRIAGYRYRPQFIDFRSPGLVNIIRSVIESDDSSMTLVEMLPDQDAFPRDAEGKAWAIELLLDSIALGASGQSLTVPADAGPASADSIPHQDWRGQYHRANLGSSTQEA